MYMYKYVYIHLHTIYLKSCNILIYIDMASDAWQSLSHGAGRASTINVIYTYRITKVVSSNGGSPSHHNFQY